MDDNTIIEEIQKLTGKNVPVSISRNPDRSLNSIEYQKEWQEGGTKPVKNRKGVVVDYKPDYKKVSLTKDDAKKLDAYIAEHVTK